MRKKNPPTDEEIIKNEWLVKFERKSLTKDKIYGFVLAVSNSFSLLQIFDESLFALDGYCVIRNKDVTRYAVYDSDEYFLSAFLKIKKFKPKPLANFSLESWKDILVSANEYFPLVTIHQEKINNKVCYVGKLAETKKKKFSISEIDSEAVWIEKFKYSYDDLTKVDFGGNYENALYLVAGYRTNEKP